MSKSDLIKRIADHLALLGFGLLLTLIVVGLILAGKVTIIEDVIAVRWLDLVCVLGLVGYAVYRIRDLFKDVKKVR
jgi:hypothetical protein